MSLKQWRANGWLKPHKTSSQEFVSLFNIVKRDLADASQSLSNDWKFGIAYNAALKLCTILLYSEGFRPAHGLHHYRTIMAMPLILGKSKAADAQYLDSCRAKRNILEYECTGEVSQKEAEELIDYVKELEQEVISRFIKHHPEISL